MQHQVNLRGEKKHHDTIRDMMATSSHGFYSISRGGTQWVYGGRLFVVSARTNKRHHHHHRVREACLDDRVREAAKWLQAAFDGGPWHPFAKLHLAHLTSFDAGQEDAALAHFKEHLSWRVHG